MDVSSLLEVWATLAGDPETPAAACQPCSGEAPPAGPAAAGTAGSGAGASGDGGSSPDSEPPDADDEDGDFFERLWDWGSEVFGEAGSDVNEEYRDPSSRSPFRHLNISPPRMPSNPLDGLLSEEGAQAQEGAAEMFNEQRAREAADLSSADADFQEYYDQRQRDPYDDLGD